jgi:tetratricopeptide (TPR) repeat protein
MKTVTTPRTLCVLAFVVGTALAGCNRDPHAAMLKYARSGDSYMAKGKVAEAIVEYRNALDKEPRAGEVRIKLAEAYLRQGAGGNAVQEYVRAADVMPDAGVQIKAGNLLLLARRFDDAKVRATKALDLDHKNVDAQILLANALAGLKDLDGAVAQLEEAIRLNPDRSATYSNLGQIELTRGKREEAERAFRRAVQLAPKSGTAHLALANFLWMTGQLPGAEQELTEALAVEPDNPLTHRAAASLYIATNRRDQAESHLRRVLDLTKSTQSALALADYYVVQKREMDARKVLEPLASVPATSSIANARLAVLDRNDGHADASYNRLESVLRAEPSNLEAQVLKGSFLLSDGRLDDALKIAADAVEKHREGVPAYYLLGRVQTARKQNEAAIAAYQEVIRLNPLASDAKLDLARLQLVSGRTDTSVAFAEEALKAQPQNPNARLVLVQGLIMRGDLDRAEQDLNVLKTRYPKSAPVHVQLGMLAGRRNQAADARREFEQALQLQPTSLEAVAGLVALDVAAHKFEDARARVDGLTSAADPKPAALMLAARTYATTGDPKTSEVLLRRALAADPSYLAAYAALGQLYAKQGRLNEALTELDALAGRQPKPVAALTLSGMILQSQGKNAEAQAKFEKVMQIDSQAPVAANNLAWLYVESGGNLDLALQLAQTAKQSLNESAEVNDTLGFIYYKKNLPALAIPPLKLSVEKEPNNPMFHYHLGLAYAKAGIQDQARQALTRALTLKPDFSGASDAKSVLGSLGG